ncbi:MAG: histidine triad nucleotide-binding protein [Bacillota bacterium]|nr:histidine triad nucleotide-binding protein [Bacillota bacterium]
MAECLFCRIAAKEIPAQVVYEDELIIAFRDINPQAPVHLLIIPKGHVASVREIDEAHPLVAGRLLRVARDLAKQEGVAESGYRLVVNTGQDAGQAIAHLHLHLLGGRAMGWPPG